MTNDHREDIREAAQRWTESARFALAADRDELPHAFVVVDVDDSEVDEYTTCDECGEFADHDCHDVPAGFDPDEHRDGLAGLLLDADVLTAPDDSDRWRVELSMTVGGPTVYVVADSRWTSVEFHHSWGRDQTGADVHAVNLYGDAAAVWLDIASSMAEMAADR